MPAARMVKAEGTLSALHFAGGLDVQEQGRVRLNVEVESLASLHQAEGALLLEDPLTVHRTAIQGAGRGAAPLCFGLRWISLEVQSRHSCLSLSP